MGSKVLERNVCVSNSEIKAEKEQPDHKVGKFFDSAKIRQPATFQPRLFSGAPPQYEATAASIAFQVELFINRHLAL